VEDAEDLINTVFERAYTHREQFDQARGSFSTWLFRIAHNMLANYYRTRKRRSAWESEAEPPVDLLASDPSPEAQVMAKETVVQLLQGLERLTERDQEVITLKFAGKLSNKEIGEIMDMKEKTVSVTLLRAMRRLRQEIEPGEEVES
jgi:RNA polymerase sigma-70 factor (ECF subfamily)